MVCYFIVFHFGNSVHLFHFLENTTKSSLASPVKLFVENDYQKHIHKKRKPHGDLLSSWGPLWIRLNNNNQMRPCSRVKVFFSAMSWRRVLSTSSFLERAEARLFKTEQNCRKVMAGGINQKNARL